MKLALVSLAARDSPEALPLGAACIAAAVKAAASRPGSALATLECVLVDAGLGESPESLAARVLATGAGLVGFSVYSWNRDTFAATAHRLRGAAGGLLLFAGGPETGPDPQGLMAEADLDFIVAGEGEGGAVLALRAILGGGALASVPGLVLPGSGSGPAPIHVEEPSSLASPWLLGTLDPADCGGDVIWELSRGCPFRCAYCYESKGASGSRPFPMERIEAELDLFVRSGVSYIFVLDPTFDADAKRAALLLDLFRAKAPWMRWKFEVRAELLDKGLIRRFAALDCSLQIGLQSARRETLETAGRPGFDRGAFARTAAMLGAAGVSFGLDLIYGLPGDSLRDFEEGLDFALGLEPNHLDLFPLALLPGTSFFDRAGELGLVAELHPPYLVTATRELPAGDLARAAALARSCDRFYSTGRAMAWFLAALRPLKTRPSVFLRGFSDWLGGRGADASGMGGEAYPPSMEPNAISAEQLGYLGERYRSAGLESLLPALNDLVRLHTAWGLALAEGEESTLDLTYDPEEVLGAAGAGLAAYVRSASVSRATWRVLPDEEEGARLEEAPRARPQGSQARKNITTQRDTKAK